MHMQSLTKLILSITKNYPNKMKIKLLKEKLNSKFIYFIAGTLLSTLLTFLIAFNLKAYELGEFYVYTTSANILSSLIIGGSAYYYYAFGKFESNPLLRMVIATFFLYIFFGDIFLTLVVMNQTIEKIFTPIMVEKEMNYKIWILPQMLALIIVTIAIFYQLGGEAVAFLRTAPFLLLFIYYLSKKYNTSNKEIISKENYLRFLPSRKELSYLLNELLLMAADSGVISASALFFSRDFSARIGFARSSSSFGFILYNWSVVNLMSRQSTIIHLSKIFILMFAASIVIYITRFKDITFNDILWLIYFSLIPLLAGTLNQKLKIKS